MKRICGYRGDSGSRLGEPDDRRTDGLLSLLIGLVLFLVPSLLTSSSAHLLQACVGIRIILSGTKSGRKATQPRVTPSQADKASLGLEYGEPTGDGRMDGGVRMVDLGLNPEVGPTRGSWSRERSEVDD